MEETMRVERVVSVDELRDAAAPVDSIKDALLFCIQLENQIVKWMTPVQDDTSGAGRKSFLHAQGCRKTKRDIIGPMIVMEDEPRRRITSVSDETVTSHCPTP